MPESPNASPNPVIAPEATSPDRYISRARPSFLYLMYGMILLSLPMGLISAISAPVAVAITNGVRLWLTSLPDGLYALFGTGYLGYTAARQWGKVAGTDR